MKIDPCGKKLDTAMGLLLSAYALINNLERTYSYRQFVGMPETITLEISKKTVLSGNSFLYIVELVF